MSKGVLLYGLKVGMLSSVVALALLAMSEPRPARAATPQIVGGGSATQGQWASVAYVTVNTGSGTDWCTGTVVAPNVVLTAGHCVVDLNTLDLWPASAFQVTTGSVTLGQGQTSAVTQSALDPAWLNYSGPVGENPDHDVALLQLATPTSAPTMTLATSANANLYAVGTAAAIAGWGMTVSGDGYPPDTLQYGYTVVQDQTYCANWASNLNAEFDASDQICGVYAPYYSDGTCQGDSGGPMVANNNGALVEIGVTSWSSANCDTSKPDFFANVASLSGWLDPEIQALSPPAVTTGAASSVTETTATLGGTVVTYTSGTSFHFDYGTTTAYGQASNIGTVATSATVNATAGLTGLQPATTYHYRLDATNANGTTYGADSTFTTAAAPAAAPPPPPPRPRAGVYRGSTSQRQPIKLTVAANQTTIPDIKFGFAVRCTKLRRKRWFTLNAYGGKAFPLPIKRNVDLSSSFWDASNDRYVFTATFTTAGTIAGTFTAGYKDRSDGTCRSGLVHWSAKL